MTAIMLCGMMAMPVCAVGESANVEETTGENTNVEETTEENAQVVGKNHDKESSEQNSSDTQEEIVDDGILGYVALGDSISNGYSDDPESEIISYPQLIANDLQEIAGEEVELARDTKNGLTTTKLNSVILQREDVQESLKKADLVTVTIGANDLMNQFKKVSREILNNNTHFMTANQALEALQDGIKANPLLLVKVVSAISNWDYTSFEEQWKLAMENIDDLRPEGSEMVVTTIYNPTESMELPGTLNAIVEGLISKMNDIILSYADDYEYQVVELMDSGIGEKVQSDGLHPNQEGQQLICDLMEETAKSEPFEVIREYRVEQEKEKQEALEAAKRQKEQEEAERKAQEKAEERKKTVLSCVSLAVAVGLMALLRKKTENEIKSEREKKTGDKK